jgi:uncharacterized protein (DUF2062 family)
MKRFLRYHYLKFLRLRGDPRALARGAAIGAFLGILPIIPLRTIAIIATTTLIRSSTIAAIIMATIISNPLTYVPLYFISVLIGNTVTPYNLNWERVQEMLNLLAVHPGFKASLLAVLSLGREALVVLLAGGGLLALPACLVVYYLSYHFFARRHNRKGPNLYT